MRYQQKLAHPRQSANDCPSDKPPVAAFEDAIKILKKTTSQ
jgi:hypothetical protein